MKEEGTKNPKISSLFNTNHKNFVISIEGEKITRRKKKEKKKRL